MSKHNLLSDQQLAVIGALELLGKPSTSKEIAELLELKTLSVANTLCWLRGMSVVDDGSVADRVFGSKGQLLGIASTPARSPITWTLKARNEWRLNEGSRAG
jgi:hypothetical protein